MARLRNRVSAYAANLGAYTPTEQTAIRALQAPQDQDALRQARRRARTFVTPTSNPARTATATNPTGDFTGRASTLLSAQQMPFSAAFDTKVNAINTGLSNTLAGLDNDENRIRQQFGFEDTSDPFSRARMLQRAYEQRQRGNTNSYAAAGQLYSGALNRQRGETLHGYQEAEHGLRNDYQELLGRLAARRTELKTQAEMDVADAGFDRLQAALDAPPAPSTATNSEAAAMAFANGDPAQLAALLALQAPQDLEALRRARRRARRGG